MTAFGDAGENMGPRVSVIVPVYNSREYLPQCLSSIRGQTLDDIEVILVDDGSEDGSLDYALEEFDWGALSARVRSVEQLHRGPGVARNAGLELATGEYVLFVDSDDFIEPTLLERAVSQADRLSSDIVIWDIWFYCNIRKVDYHPPVGTLDFPRFASPEEAAERSFSFEDDPDAILTSFQNWPWNKLFRRSFIEGCGLRFPELFLTEDLPFTGEALVRAERMSLIYERLSHYRTRREASSMGSKDSRPLDFLSAFLLLKSRLEELGLFGQVGDSFRVWALIGAVANLNTLHTATALREVFSRLKGGGLRELGILDVPEERYEDWYFRDALRLIVSGSLDEYLLWRSRCADWAIEDQRVTIDQWECRERELLGELAEHDRRAAEGRDALLAELDEARRRERDLLASRDYRLGESLLRLPRAAKRAVRGSGGR